MNTSWKLLRGGVLGIVGRASLIGFQFLSHVVLARQLGTTGYGVLSLAIPIVVIAAFVARAGIPRVLQKYIPAYLEEKNFGALSGLLRWSFQRLVAFSLFVTVVLVIAAPLLEVTVFPHAGLSQTLQVISISIVFMNLVSWFGAFGLSIGRVRFEVLGQHFVQPALFLLLLVTLVIFWGGELQVVAAAAALTVSWGVTAVFIWTQAVKVQLVPDRSIADSIDAHEWKRFSVRAALPELVNRARIWVDLLVAGALLTSDWLGIFAVCLRIAIIPSNILAAFGSIFLHKIGTLYAKGDFDEIRSQYASITFSALSLSLPLIVFLALLSPSILAIFGPDFSSGFVTLQIILTGQVVIALLGPCWPVMLLTGSERELLAYSVVAIALSIGLCLILIPIFGIVGAGSASAASVSALSLIQVVHLHKKFQIKPLRIWSIRLAPPIVLTVLAEVARRYYWPLENPFAEASAATLTFAVVYLTTSLLFGVWQVALVGDVFKGKKIRKWS